MVVTSGYISEMHAMFFPSFSPFLQTDRQTDNSLLIAFSSLCENKVKNHEGMDLTPNVLEGFHFLIQT